MPRKRKLDTVKKEPKVRRIADDESDEEEMRSDSSSCHGGGAAEIEDSPSDSEHVRDPIPQKIECLLPMGTGQGRSLNKRTNKAMADSSFKYIADLQRRALIGEHSRGGTERIRGGLTPDSSSTNLANLLTSPFEIMFPGAFDGAKEEATNAEKWLLVDIQLADEFVCLKLNRDVWRNEFIQDFVRKKFVFWQQSSTSDEGARFMRYYKVTDFPYIAIVDPRTGEKMVSWQCCDAATFRELAEDFINSHPYPKGEGGYKAKNKDNVHRGDDSDFVTSNYNRQNIGSRRTKSEIDRTNVVNLSEEEQLAIAIRESMDQLSKRTKHMAVNNSNCNTTSNSQKRRRHRRCEFLVDSSDEDVKEDRDSPAAEDLVCLSGSSSSSDGEEGHRHTTSKKAVKRPNDRTTSSSFTTATRKKAQDAHFTSSLHNRYELEGPSTDSASQTSKSSTSALVNGLHSPNLESVTKSSIALDSADAYCCCTSQYLCANQQIVTVLPRRQPSSVRTTSASSSHQPSSSSSMSTPPVLPSTLCDHVPHPSNVSNNTVSSSSSTLASSCAAVSTAPPSRPQCCCCCCSRLQLKLRLPDSSTISFLTSRSVTLKKLLRTLLPSPTNLDSCSNKSSDGGGLFSSTDPPRLLFSRFHLLTQYPKRTLTQSLDDDAGFDPWKRSIHLLRVQDKELLILERR